ncbi:DUF805 domain-containing protein [Streptacidiphilus sp. N1-12]|uniref:DUF805 domain-containing protein n=2 Tax=Streptacidiphilus alkalitolerans TaxID=3342712 RepID=A0ABV6VLA5_9ACTN
MNWYVSCVKNYFGFGGRARRQEYWMFTLFHVIFLVALFVIGLVIHTQIPYFVYGIALLIPGLAASFRRLHDTGRSAWWLLIALVPFGAIALLIFMVSEGQAAENKFGPNPKLAPALG